MRRRSSRSERRREGRQRVAANENEERFVRRAINCYGFKGDAAYTVGVLLQANFGRRAQLMVAGVPVGQDTADSTPYDSLPGPSTELGSVIVIVGTDAPLLPHQLKRLTRRVTTGLARTGAVSGNGSGDLFVAFSTANAGAYQSDRLSQAQMLGNDQRDPIFTAVVQATEESVINALVAGESMTGQLGYRAVALPFDRLREVLKQYNRLVAPERRDSSAR